VRARVENPQQSTRTHFQRRDKDLHSSDVVPCEYGWCAGEDYPVLVKAG
jgi:hypothetical protein